MIRSQVDGADADEDVERAEVRGVAEAEPAAEPTAAREVPSLSPSSVVPYGPPTWTDGYGDGYGDRRRMVLGQDVMLEGVWGSQDWRGTLMPSWLHDFGPDYSAAFGAAGFTASGFASDDPSSFFASPDFGSVRFRSFRYGRAGFGPAGGWQIDVSASYSPLIIGPPAFGSGDEEWITIPANRGYAPAMR